MIGFRLVDGTRPEDWSPSNGDAPCRWNSHDGTHSRNGCPDLYPM